MTPPRGTCSHSGLQSGAARYLREEGRLQFVIVCDDCGAEQREVNSLDYAPDFDPHGSIRPAKAARCGS